MDRAASRPAAETAVERRKSRRDFDFMAIPPESSIGFDDRLPDVGLRNLKSSKRFLGFYV
jgi:hypothetical protein